MEKYYNQKDRTVNETKAAMARGLSYLQSSFQGDVLTDIQLDDVKTFLGNNEPTAWVPIHKSIIRDLIRSEDSVQLDLSNLDSRLNDTTTLNIKPGDLPRSSPIISLLSPSVTPGSGKYQLMDGGYVIGEGIFKPEIFLGPLGSNLEDYLHGDFFSVREKVIEPTKYETAAGFVCTNKVSGGTPSSYMSLHGDFSTQTNHVLSTYFYSRTKVSNEHGIAHVPIINSAVRPVLGDEVLFDQTADSTISKYRLLASELIEEEVVRQNVASLSESRIKWNMLTDKHYYWYNDVKGINASGLTMLVDSITPIAEDQIISLGAECVEVHKLYKRAGFKFDSSLSLCSYQCRSIAQIPGEQEDVDVGRVFLGVLDVVNNEIISLYSSNKDGATLRNRPFFLGPDSNVRTQDNTDLIASSALLKDLKFSVPEGNKLTTAQEHGILKEAGIVNSTPYFVPQNVLTSKMDAGFTITSDDVSVISNSIDPEALFDENVHIGRIFEPTLAQPDSICKFNDDVARSILNETKSIKEIVVSTKSLVKDLDSVSADGQPISQIFQGMLKTTSAVNTMSSDNTIPLASTSYGGTLDDVFFDKTTGKFVGVPSKGSSVYRQSSSRDRYNTITPLEIFGVNVKNFEGSRKRKVTHKPVNFAVLMEEKPDSFGDLKGHSENCPCKVGVTGVVKLSYGGPIAPVGSVVLAKLGVADGVFSQRKTPVDSDFENISHNGMILALFNTVSNEVIVFGPSNHFDAVMHTSLVSLQNLNVPAYLSKESVFIRSLDSFEEKMTSSVSTSQIMSGSMEKHLPVKMSLTLAKELWRYSNMVGNTLFEDKVKFNNTIIRRGPLHAFYARNETSDQQGLEVNGSYKELQLSHRLLLNLDYQVSTGETNENKFLSHSLSVFSFK